MTNSWIGTRGIIERVTRLLPEYAVNKLNIEEVCEYIYEAIKLIGGLNCTMVSTITRTTTTDLTLELPTCIEDLIEVRLITTREKIKFLKVNSHIATDRYIYRIDNGTCITDLKETELELDITHFPIDNEGNPAIPDTIYYEKAVVSYIVERIFYKLYIMDLINENKYERARQEWIHYQGAARVGSIMPRADEDYKFSQTHLKVFNNIHRGMLPRDSTNVISRVEIENLNALVNTQGTYITPTNLY